MYRDADRGHNADVRRCHLVTAAIPVITVHEHPSELLPLLVAVLGTMAPMKRDVHSVRERMEGLSLGFCTPAPWPINPKSLADRPALVRCPSLRPNKTLACHAEPCQRFLQASTVTEYTGKGDCYTIQQRARKSLERGCLTAWIALDSRVSHHTSRPQDNLSSPVSASFMVVLH